MGYRHMTGVVAVAIAGESNPPRCRDPAREERVNHGGVVGGVVAVPSADAGRLQVAAIVSVASAVLGSLALTLNCAPITRAGGTPQHPPWVSISAGSTSASGCSTSWPAMAVAPPSREMSTELNLAVRLVRREALVGWRILLSVRIEAVSSCLYPCVPLCPYMPTESRFSGHSPQLARPQDGGLDEALPIPETVAAPAAATPRHWKAIYTRLVRTSLHCDPPCPRGPCRCEERSWQCTPPVDRLSLQRHSGRGQLGACMHGGLGYTRVLRWARLEVDMEGGAMFGAE